MKLYLYTKVLKNIAIGFAIAFFLSAIVKIFLSLIDKTEDYSNTLTILTTISGIGTIVFTIIYARFERKKNYKDTVQFMDNFLEGTEDNFHNKFILPRTNNFLNIDYSAIAISNDFEYVFLYDNKRESTYNKNQIIDFTMTEKRKLAKEENGKLLNDNFDHWVLIINVRDHKNPHYSFKIYDENKGYKVSALLKNVINNNRISE